MNRPVTAILIFFVAIGVLLRCYGMFGDLWLDEIWSIKFAIPAQTFSDLLYSNHTDNNHLLNSLLLHLIGPTNKWWLYRLPAVLASLGMLFVFFKIAKQFGPIQQRVSVVLCALSYPMILYASEARGYSLMLFFAVSSFYIVQPFSRFTGLFRVALFWLTAMLGFFSHFSFLVFYLALLGMSLWEWAVVKNRSQKIRELIAIHLVPLTVMLIVYFSFIVSIPSGGGPEYRFLEVLVNSFALAVNAGEFSVYSPIRSVLGILVSGLLIGILASEIWKLFYERQELAIFFLLLLVILPGLIVLLNPALLFPRYFLPCMLFSFFLLGRFIARCFGETGYPRSIIGFLVALYFIGSLFQSSDFVRFRRGSYREALQYILSRSTHDPVRIVVDHPFRDKMMLDFYLPVVAPQRSIKYSGDFQNPSVFADWALQQSFYQGARPSSDLVLGNNRFVFREEFRSAPLSGWTWFLYQRVADDRDARMD